MDGSTTDPQRENWEEHILPVGLGDTKERGQVSSVVLDVLSLGGNAFKMPMEVLSSRSVVEP